MLALEYKITVDVDLHGFQESRTLQDISTVIVSIIVKFRKYSIITTQDISFF